MKLEKYNQRLLAIIGTLVLVSVVVIMLTSGSFFIIELVHDFRRERSDNTLVATPTYDSISGTLIRTQQITFNSPILIDSALRQYLIPVSQVNLKNAENIQYLLDVPSYGIELKENPRNSYYGRYNNFIIYDQGPDQREFVFPYKASINRYSYYNLKGKFYLLFEGAKTDTNGDEFLNDNDLSSFFVYEIATKQLTEISYSSMGLVEYYLTKDESEIMLSFAIDKNGNGEIEEYQEPVILKKLSIENKKVLDFIESSQIEMIQKMVDH